MRHVEIAGEKFREIIGLADAQADSAGLADAAADVREGDGAFVESGGQGFRRIVQGHLNGSSRPRNEHAPRD